MTDYIKRSDALELAREYYSQGLKEEAVPVRAIRNIPSADVWKWIPVSERLPKLGEMVAVYMHSAIHGDEVKIDRMVISNTTDIPYWSFYKGRVKAWMPLPEPPKDGGT